MGFDEWKNDTGEVDEDSANIRENQCKSKRKCLLPPYLLHVPDSETQISAAAGSTWVGHHPESGCVFSLMLSYLFSKLTGKHLWRPKSSTFFIPSSPAAARISVTEVDLPEGF